MIVLSVSSKEATSAVQKAASLIGYSWQCRLQYFPLLLISLTYKAIMYLL